MRAHRWAARRADGELEDGRPGGSPMHGLLAEEVAEIVAIYREWAEVDRSHRKLAHRGSYLERVWVSPSSVRRVLAAQGLRLEPLPRTLAAIAPAETNAVAAIINGQRRRSLTHQSPATIYAALTVR